MRQEWMVVDRSNWGDKWESNEGYRVTPTRIKLPGNDGDYVEYFEVWSPERVLLGHGQLRSDAFAIADRDLYARLTGGEPL